MKTKKYIILKALFMVIASVVFFFACKEEDQVQPLPRLFSPVLTKDMSAKDNTIIISMANVNGTKSFTIQVSKDTFKTIDATVESDTSVVVIKDLLWGQRYMVSAKAHAADSTHDSKLSILGFVSTENFPTIITKPDPSDVIDQALKLRWTNAGAPVTTIRVYKKSDNSLVKEVSLTSTDVTNQYKIVSGLVASTVYTVYLYSGDATRGWVDLTTRPPFLTGTNIIDLRGIVNRPSVLADTLALIGNSMVVVLDRGLTYYMPSAATTKTVTIVSGYSFTPDPAKIKTSTAAPAVSNWDVAAGASVDSIVFRDVTIEGADWTAHYVFNINRAGVNVGLIKFDNCKIRKLRGIIRLRSTTTIQNYTIVNCQVDSIRDYGIFTVDTNNQPRIANCSLKNSTFSKGTNMMASFANSATISIEGCTFNEFPGEGATAIIRYRGGAGNNNITGGLKIKDTIWGSVFDANNDNIIGTVVGYEGLPTTTFDISNTYKTSDFVMAASTATTGPINGMNDYSKKAIDLYDNPPKGIFTYKDATFIGRFTVGDPRWRSK